MYLEATEELNTLYSFRHKQHFKAGQGGSGASGRKHGARGKDLVIRVPVGTMVRVEGEEVVADLSEPGAKVEIARGGKGGLGNVHFATAVMQAPRIAQKGEPGQEKWLDLELRLLADVGLVGLPNAGKSTLLSRISAARPKIAAYPFTTLVPNLGVIAVDDSTFVVADIPGLIQGAHKGAGLGLEFLRHVRRTRLLIHLLDGTSADPVQDMETVNRELAEYSEELRQRPQLVAFNKMDLPEARDAWPRVEARLKSMGIEARMISGATGEGVKELLGLVAGMLSQAPAKKVPAEEEGLRVYRLEAAPEEGVAIEKEGDAFRVKGKAAERAARLTNVGTPEGMAVLKGRLGRLGLVKMLRRAGASPGDLVRVGDVEFRWEGSRR